jgi:hypothetical protein
VRNFKIDVFQVMDACAPNNNAFRGHRWNRTFATARATRKALAQKGTLSQNASELVRNLSIIREWL